MSPITTHVLDTARGRPAAGVSAVLERKNGAAWEAIGRGITNEDGRIADLVAAPLPGGIHRLTFDTGAYFAAQGVAGFYPQVAIEFEVRAGEPHTHVPLLLSPFGYSTYRGS
jgi:5-hydroxyisourate hydrolase